MGRPNVAPYGAPWGPWGFNFELLFVIRILVGCFNFCNKIGHRAFSLQNAGLARLKVNFRDGSGMLNRTLNIKTRPDSSYEPEALREPMGLLK